MNKVTTVNLNGNAYQLEESGYDALRTYLEAAARRLEGNPDKDEIIADIEQAIADKFRALLGSHKSVVAAKEVTRIIAEMGPVEDGTAPADDPAPDKSPHRAPPAPGSSAGAAGTPGDATGAPKRLYKFKEGAMIGGVCNGLAIYLDIDVTIVRLVFALLTLIWGLGPVAYLIMLIIVPTARTPEEKAAASGMPSTAQDFIRRAKEGYYEGMKTFGDRRAHREWRRNFKREMRGWSRAFKREMHDHAHEWKYQWQRHWGPAGPTSAGSWVAVSFLSLLSGLLALLTLAAVISVLSTHAIFGWALPAGMPWWGGLLLLFVVYKLVTWPFKTLRWAFFCQSGGAAHPAVQFVGWVQSLAWLAFVIFLVWYADHHVAHVHRAMEGLPTLARQMADSLREWWTRR